jgi:hypothetical protein
MPGAAGAGVIGVVSFIAVAKLHRFTKRLGPTGEFIANLAAIAALLCRLGRLWLAIFGPAACSPNCPD